MPPTETPLVALPHMPRYPLSISGVWHATCKCHWWAPFATEAKAGVK